MPKRLRKTTEWSSLVAQWKQTGLSVKQFCEGEGLCESRFYEMRKQLETGINKRSKKNNPREKKQAAQKQFIPVEIKPVPNTVQQQKELGFLEIVTPTGHLIRIR
jgi:hypothetical protein